MRVTEKVSRSRADQAFTKDPTTRIVKVTKYGFPHKVMLCSLKIEKFFHIAQILPSTGSVFKENWIRLKVSVGFIRFTALDTYRFQYLLSLFLFHSQYYLKYLYY